jgi:hypothetical protein
LAVAMMQYNPLMVSQRVFHEILLDDASIFIEKTLAIAPELKLGMQKEYVKAMHEFYKQNFKQFFKELHAAAQYKKVQLNFELAEKCPLDVAMSFSVPVRLKQLISKVKAVNTYYT